MSIVGKSSQLYSGFNPTHIAGCQLWLDAADSDTITLSGSSITQWRDKSGNGRNAAGNGTPTYSATGFNSKPTVQITPSGRMIAPMAAGTLPTGFAIFVVYQKTGANNAFDTIVTRGVGNIAGPLDLYTGSGPTTNRFVGSGGSYRVVGTSSDVPCRITTPTILCMNVFSATPSVWNESINGTLTTYTLSSVVGTGEYGDVADSFYIGRRADGATYMTGNISEVLVYGVSSFSTSQRQQIEGYLARKWGLQSSLPTTHPYKSTAPYSRPLTPVDIPGCQLWLDAADRSTMTMSGSNVTQWRDKSGNGFVAANSGTVTIGTSTQKQIPVLSMSGSSMNIASFSQSVHSTTIVVAKPIVDYYGWRIDLYKTYFATFNNDLYYFNAGTAIVFRDSALGAGVSIASPNAYYIFAMGYAGGTAASIYNLNGTSRGTVQTGGSAVANTTITGTFFVNGFGGNIEVCEALIYNRSISTVELRQIEGYLADKWGLRGSLPSTQPFKLVYPLTPAFTPLGAGNCILWLDAADTGTIATSSGSSNVTTWSNKGSFGGLLSNFSGSGTSLTTGNTLNGCNFLRSPAGGELQSSFNTAITGQSRSCFVVFRRNAPFSAANRVYTLLQQQSGTGTGNFRASFDYSTVDSTNYRFWFWSTSSGTGRIVANVSASIFTSPFIVSAVHSTNTASNAIAVNGLPLTLIANTAATDYTTATYSWRTTSPSASLEPGVSVDYMEILYFSNALTPAERQQVEGYLAAKWGLKNNLPSTHAYKTLTP